MPSMSFDPIADRYDATRGYPPQVARQIALALDRAAEATSETAFLEPGIGTGRIAFPLASLGHIYTGVDIAQQMLARLESKLRGQGWLEDRQPWGSLPDEDPSMAPSVSRFLLPSPPASLRLVVADMSRLPFLDASFDVVIAVHVLHLVARWQQALEETLRVLKSGGLLLHCWDEHEKTEAQTVTDKWRELVHDMGVSTRRPGGTLEEINAFWRERGLQAEELYAVTWDRPVTVRQSLESITTRSWSSTWVVPDDVFAATVERLQRWIKEQYGDDLDKEIVLKSRFVISKTRVP